MVTHLRFILSCYKIKNVAFHIIKFLSFLPERGAVDDHIGPDRDDDDAVGDGDAVGVGDAVVMVMVMLW